MIALVAIKRYFVTWIPLLSIEHSTQHSISRNLSQKKQGLVLGEFQPSQQLCRCDAFEKRTAVFMFNYFDLALYLKGTVLKT